MKEENNMRIRDIAEHLSNNGFAKRRKWKNMVIAFGMDKLHGYTEGVDKKGYKFDFNFCLDDFKADDWEKIDLYWKCPNDDFVFFESYVK